MRKCLVWRGPKKYQFSRNKTEQKLTRKNITNRKNVQLGIQNIWWSWIIQILTSNVCFSLITQTPVSNLQTLKMYIYRKTKTFFFDSLWTYFFFKNRTNYDKETREQSNNWKLQSLFFFQQIVTCWYHFLLFLCLGSYHTKQAVI